MLTVCILPLVVARSILSKIMKRSGSPINSMFSESSQLNQLKQCQLAKSNLFQQMLMMILRFFINLLRVEVLSENMVKLPHQKFYLKKVVKTSMSGKNFYTESSIGYKDYKNMGQWTQDRIRERILRLQRTKSIQNSLET